MRKAALDPFVADPWPGKSSKGSIKSLRTRSTPPRFSAVRFKLLQSLTATRAAAVLMLGEGGVYEGRRASRGRPGLTASDSGGTDGGGVSPFE